MSMIPKYITADMATVGDLAVAGAESPYQDEHLVFPPGWTIAWQGAVLDTDGHPRGAGSIGWRILTESVLFSFDEIPTTIEVLTMRGTLRVPVRFYRHAEGWWPLPVGSPTSLKHHVLLKVVGQ